MTSPRVRQAAVLPAACAVLTLAVLAPLLAPGYVLVYDMVFTPRQPLLPDGLGLGSALPRAVPVDAVVALLSVAVPGAVVQKVALAAALFGAALGAGRLVPTERTATRVVAAVVYGWNAYLAERLFLGHWTLLLAYASLPWVVAAGLRLRRGEPGAWAGLVLACAPAVLVPTGGVLAAAVALAVVLPSRTRKLPAVLPSRTRKLPAVLPSRTRKLPAESLRRVLPVLGIAVVLNAPWWVPAALHPGGTGSDPAAVGAFAARGEGPGGPLASLLGLGGVWNAQAAPASRGGLLVPVAALLLVAGVLAGLRPLARAWGTGPVRALGGLAVAGLVLAGAGALPGTGGALRWAVVHLPGAGLLRDGQKWVAWWALLAALCGALAVEALARRLPDKGLRAVLVTGAVLLPVVLLPDLAWGGLGRLSPVEYPREWSAVRDLVARDPHQGDVLVLPFSAFRQFAWNGGRTLLDPAPRYLPRATVVDDTLPVGPVSVAGEDPRAARVRTAMGAGQPLGRLGIGWVLVEHGTPGATEVRVPGGLVTVHEGQWLSLYRVPDDVLPGRTATAPRAPVLGADAAALALVAAALLRRWLLTGRLRKLPGSGAPRKDGGTGADTPRIGRRAGGRPRAGPGRDLRPGVGERAGREGGATA
ncbi:MAG: hypothetical protein V7603_1702 [Micromonosporaceae bacterium]